jgi:hypothetical protein
MLEVIAEVEHTADYAECLRAELRRLLRLVEYIPRLKVTLELCRATPSSACHMFMPLLYADG